MNKGYRGYIGSRPYQSGDYPQQIQNLVIRTYCQQHKLGYLLSATEYAMPGCYMMLEEVLNSLEVIDGIVLFSLFMLPENKLNREKIYDKILMANKTLHAAFESIQLQADKDIHVIEELLSVHNIVANQNLITMLQNE